MDQLLHITRYGALAGTVPSGIDCLMVVVAAFTVRAAQAAGDAGGPVFLLPLSVLKPLHGVEPGMDLNLESFFQQDYPEFELLFCARHGSDEGLLLAQEIGRRYKRATGRDQDLVDVKNLTRNTTR